MIAARSVSAAMFVVLLGPGSMECAAQIEPSRARPMRTAELAERIGQPGWLIADVRDSNAFNGWVMGEEKRGGHIRGATNLSLRWMEAHHPAALRLVASKGLTEKQVVLYGNSASEAHRMATLLQRLAQLSSQQLFIYTEGIAGWSRDNNLPMDRLPRYENLVPPSWLHQLIQTGDFQDDRIIEVAWRKAQRYEAGHLPGAVYLDTDEIESEPMWNVVSAHQLETTLLSLGITKNTRVVVYGRNSTAAARAAVVMMHAGVSDVRLLNGGYQAWLDAGFPVATGSVQRQPKTTFGARIPVHPEWIIGTEQAKQVLAARHGRLVSIRSWAEYIGQTSGYSYIKPKGRIGGAVWGHAGTPLNPMQDFRNPDNTLRDYHEIAANWRARGIEPSHEISFYCGTGWRASEAFFAAYLMGYKEISVYDGGWYEWSADKTNPVASGTPEAEPR